MNVRATLGANLKRFREMAGLTQTQLGDKVGVTWQTISNYESGARWPQADVLDLLAKHLKLRPWQLLASEGEGGSVPPELRDLVALAAQACGLKVSR